MKTLGKNTMDSRYCPPLKCAIAKSLGKMYFFFANVSGFGTVAF